MDEVPDDQEVVGEPHLLDRLQLEAQPVGQLGRRASVAPVEALLTELDEIVERVATVRDREGGQQDPAELELDVAALRDLERPRHRVLEAREVARHLLGRLEEELARIELPVVRVLERVARLDAEERLVREGVLRVEVMDVAGRDERQAGLFCERDQPRVDLLLLGEPGVLDLDVRRVAPEDLDEPVEIGVGVLRPAFGEGPRHPAREAAGQRHDPLRVTLEQFPVDPRLVVVALEVAERGELDEIGVALVRLGEEGQVRVPLRLRPPVVRDVDLAPDDRLHAALPRLPVELDRSCKRPVVRERDRRHLEPRRLLDERRNPTRPVEDRVLRMHVQVDEARRGTTHGRAMLIGPRDDLETCPCREDRTPWSGRRSDPAREAAGFRDPRATGISR